MKIAQTWYLIAPALVLVVLVFLWDRSRSTEADLPTIATSNSDRAADIVRRPAAEPSPATSPISPTTQVARSSELIINVADKLTREPLRNVIISLKCTPIDKRLGVSDANGRLGTQESLPTDATFYATLPTELGGDILPCKLLSVDAKSCIAEVGAFAELEIQVSEATPGEGALAGRTWVVAWPTIDQLFSTPLPSEAFEKLATQRKACIIDSVSLKEKAPLVRYYSSAREISGCNTARLLQYSSETTTVSPSVYRVPFDGEVIVDGLFPKHRHNRTRLHITRGERRAVAIRLERQRQISGRVVDRTGQGVAGSLVQLCAKTYIAPGEPVPSRFTVYFTPAGSAASVAVFQEITRSDTDGAYTFKIDAADEVFVCAVKPGTSTEWLVKRLSPAWSEIELDIAVDKIPKPQADSKVLRSGNTLADIDLQIIDLEPIEQAFQVQYPTVKTDTNGMVDLSLLVPGRQYLLTDLSTSKSTKPFRYVRNAPIEFPIE